MKKRKKSLPLLLALILALSAVPAAAEPTAGAADDSGTEAVLERDPGLPESYYTPIATDAVEGWPKGPAVWADSAVVMDYDTGTILYAKEMDKQEYPASITKLMTVLLALENSSPEERVFFSEHAIWGIERDSSHIGIRVGEVLSMEDCLYGILLESANEVCIAVAEHIAGSEEAFVQMMNDRAAELGCTNTHFVTTNGLHDDSHYTTAHDMALIARAVWEHEYFREIESNQIHKIGFTNRTGEERWLAQSHKMMNSSTPYYYPDCVGGKTGFTDQALNTLVTYAQRDGRTLICVNLRTNGWQNYYDTQAMLNYGFEQFHQVTADSGLSSPPGPSWLPEDPAAREAITVTVPSGVSAADLTTDSSLEGSVLTRRISYHGYTLGTLTTDLTDTLHALLQESPAIMAKQPASVSDAVKAITRPAPSRSGFFERIQAAFAALPSWKYPLVIILASLILFYIIILIVQIRRRRRRKKRKKKYKNKKSGKRR